MSGAIGYFAHELFSYANPKIIKLNLPLGIWIFYDLLYIYDHKINFAYLIASSFNSSQYNSIKLNKIKLNEWNQKILNNLSYKENNYNAKIFSFKCNLEKISKNFSKKKYFKLVNKLKKLIESGNIYQANLTYRLKIPFEGSTFELFYKLQKIHPVPYSAYINLNYFHILSFSPERFIQNINEKIKVQPMKGTRPRSNNLIKDKELKNELLKSEKDSAELLMITDLMRNDLSKVSDFGSVKVTHLKKLEIYSSTYQLTSIIESKLKKSCSQIDLIKALFPSGSVTGCPKIKATQILSKIEKENRSLFMGSIGYISFHKSLDLNVAIRTLIHQNNNLFYQVGGAIVYDSNPEDEYNETLVKQSFFLNFLKNYT